MNPVVLENMLNKLERATSWVTLMLIENWYLQVTTDNKANPGGGWGTS